MDTREIYKRHPRTTDPKQKLHTNDPYIAQYHNCINRFQSTELVHVEARLFSLADLRTNTVIFGKVEKKSKIIFLFYPPTLNIICFDEQMRQIIYFLGSVCVFLRETLLKSFVLSRFFIKL